jgi:stage IV sporulation protein FB
MFGIPERTGYDLRFRLLGIPVRVHPMFWIISALMGSQGSDLSDILIWVGCVFVSILVHEFGHGLTAKAFGYRPSIVLHGMGGLCYSESERQTPWQRLAVLICGPGAGFVLAGLVLGFVYGLHPTLNDTGARIVWDLLWINIIWGVLNLFPIWPLDGGQMAQVVLNWISPRNAARWTHALSMATAALLAVVVIARFHMVITGLFFVMFAVANYQVLQAIHHQYVHYGDDADWWKR